MKTTLKKLCITTLLSFGLSAPAWSVVINDLAAGSYNGTNVGLIDSLLGQGDKLGNPANELTWVNSIISPDSTTWNGIKTADVAYFETDTTHVFAFLLDSEPGYYLIKNATKVALYENNHSYGWGVFDLSVLSEDMNLSATDDLVISHVTEFGETTNVAEPHTLLLLGFGLLGLAYSRRMARS